MFSQQFIENFTKVEQRIVELDAEIEITDSEFQEVEFYRWHLETRILDELAQLPDPMHATAAEIEECCRKAYKRFLNFFGWTALPKKTYYKR